MENYIINNLFEFWEYIGIKSNILNRGDNFTYTNPINFSWPSKVFRIDIANFNLDELISKMKTGQIPNSLAIIENEPSEKHLLNNKFELKSVVNGMFLDLCNIEKPLNNFPTIEQVKDHNNVIEFSRIASDSFGYEVNSKTIFPLIEESKKLKLYIGKHEGKVVQCGMVFLDVNNYSGIHMIGTLPEYRGLGLGKLMTDKLLYESFENISDKAVLVASTSGERIYSKIGFVNEGALKSFSIK